MPMNKYLLTLIFLCLNNICFAQEISINEIVSKINNIKSLYYESVQTTSTDMPLPGGDANDKEKTWFKNGQKMRAGIEAVIGHLKQDHRLNRSRYSGFRGDKINLSLGCLAWNLNKLAREVA